MAKQISELSIFVASPGDVAEERELLEEVIRELNQQWSRAKGIRLELVQWATHTYPSMTALLWLKCNGAVVRCLYQD